MSEKLALIVDDSKMARVVLGKMLKEQGIDVDSVESGEDALGYLCTKIPDMIFMDHTMPGMDGFQTIRAIRNDAKNAHIPIMMYTSKEGEVFVSQARALGATAVIPKKKLRADQLVAVLEGQNLLPSAAGRTTVEVPAAPPEDAFVDSLDDDLQEVTKAVEETLKTRPTATSVPSARLLAELRDQLATDRQMDLDVLQQRLEGRLAALEERIDDLWVPRRSAKAGDVTAPRWFRPVLALMVGIVFWLAVAYWQEQGRAHESASLTSELEERIQEREAREESDRAELEREISLSTFEHIRTTTQLYAVIGDLLTRDAHFSWDEVPFNDRLAETLEDIATQLYSIGFRGDIALRSHLGRFCLRTSGNGQAALPATDSPASVCDALEMPDDDPRGLEQSMKFMHTLAAIENRFGDRIRIMLDTDGTSMPRTRYPDNRDAITAGQWNTVAARNQRVEFSFSGPN